jgi:RHS repeat-associated protein
MRSRALGWTVALLLGAELGCAPPGAEADDDASVADDNGTQGWQAALSGEHATVKDASAESGDARADAPGGDAGPGGACQALGGRRSALAVYARANVGLGEGSAVRGGDVGAKDPRGPFLFDDHSVTLWPRATVDAARTVFGASVALKSGAVAGAVATDSLRNDGGTHGAVTPFPVMPPLPVATAAQPGTADLTVAAHAVQALVAGRLRSVRVKAGGTLRLAPGAYDFAKLDVEAGGRLEVTGAVAVRVAGRVVFGADSTLGPAAGAAVRAGDVRLSADGSDGDPAGCAASARQGTVLFGERADVHALVLAPSGLVILRPHARLHGALAGHDAYLGEGAAVDFEDGFPAAVTLARTPWQMNDGEGLVRFGFTAARDGDEREYPLASVPPVSDAAWRPAPNRDTIGYQIPSTMCGKLACRTGGQFTYFQTLVTVPADAVVDTFTIQFSSVDDGARTLIFNSDHPSGAVGGTVFFGTGTGVGVADLTALVKPGEVNRVVVIHVDDCCSESYLKSALITLAGEAVGAPPAPTDDGNPCTVDACDGAGRAVHTPAADGTPCADGNVCNGNETCRAGVCAAGTAPELDDGNACTLDSCDPVAGPRHVAAADGAPCDDGNVCTSDTCQGGACRGDVVVCTQPSKVCQLGPRCDPARGPCVFDPAPAGASCADSDVCNGNEACDGSGVCQPGTPPPPPLGINPCQVAVCDPQSGWGFVPAPAGTRCDDGDVCNGAEACDGASHCQPGTPLVVDDGNACTADACDPTTGVSHTPLSDGTTCGAADVCAGKPAQVCQAGACVGAATVVDYGSTGYRYKEYAFGAEPAGFGDFAFDDGGFAVGGAPFASGGGCGIQQRLKTRWAGNDDILLRRHLALPAGAHGLRMHIAIDNDVEVLLNGRDLTGGFQTHEGCAEANQIDVTAPDEALRVGDNLLAIVARDRGVEAAIDVQVSVQLPAGATLPAPELDDGNPCTVDACDATSGVTHAPVAAGVGCSDGNACNGAETCDGAGKCAAGDPPSPPMVLPPEPCKRAVCDPVTGWSQVPVAAGTSCADGDVCNGDETCDAVGTCLPGTPPVVDDKNPCTADSCTAIGGVAHVPVPAGSSCGDGNACNGAETCSATGTCLSGAPVTCLPLDVCHVAGICDAATGTCSNPEKAGQVTPASWATAAPMLVPRYLPGVVANGSVLYAFGGCDRGTCGGARTASVEAYDATANVWSPRAPMPTARGWLAAAMLEGTLYVVGGSALDGPTAEVDAYDPAHDAWSQRPPLSIPRVAPATGALGGKLYVVGGHGADTGATTIDAVATMDVYDPASNRWSPGPVMHTARAYAGYGVINGKLYVAGGLDPNRNLLATTEVFDPAANAWTTVAPMPAPMDIPSSATANGKLYLVGGATSSSNQSSALYRQLFVYDPRTDTWSEGLSMPTARGGGAAAVIGGRIYVAGGYATAGPTGVLEVLTPETITGEPCGGNLCAGAGVCFGGLCRAATSVALDDGNPCTADSCDPVSGVLHTPVPSGTSCGLGDRCTSAPACDVTATCQPGAPVAIDDGNACTVDVCDPLVGVRHSRAPDGTLCAGGQCLAGQCQVGCTPPPPAMIGWWPGDDETPRDVRGSNDAVLHNGATFGAGFVGDGFVFDGVDDFAQLGNSPSLHVAPADDFTFDAWVMFHALKGQPGMRSAPAGDMSIADKMNPSGINRDGWRFLKQDDDRFWFCFGGGNTNGCVPGGPFTLQSLTVLKPETLNTWFHVAVTRAGNVGSLYVNGVLEATRSLGAITDTGQANLVLGTNLAEGSFLNGGLDEVELFNRALRGDEVQALYRAGSAGKCRNGLPTTNQPPAVNAGPDQAVTLPSAASLTGTVSDDGLPVGSTVQVAWTKVSGPGDVMFANASAVSTTVTFAVAGNYVLRLEASDGELTAFDDVTIAATSGCVRPSGIVGWWPLDEDGRDLIGGHTGAAQGGGFVPGAVRGAFAPGTGRIEVPHDPRLDVTALTMEGWVRLDGASGQNQAIFWKGNDHGGDNTSPYSLLLAWQYGVSPGGRVFGTPAPGRLAGMISDGTHDHLYVSNAPFPTGRFAHVAFTADGAHVRLYIDGALDVEYPQSVSPFTTGTLPLQLGGIGPPASSVSGAIDELTLYDRALSPEEILAVARAGAMGKCLPDQGPACTPPASGLVSWWPGEGSANDVMGRNPGVLQNGAATATGKVGQAFEVDAGADVFVAPNPSLDLARFTVDAWVKPSGAGGVTRFIVDKAVPGAVNYALALTPDDVAEIDVFDGGGHHAVDSGSPCPPDVWCHVAGTYDGTTLSIYVNGALGGTIGYAGTPPIGQSLWIGRRNDGTYPFAGLIDEVDVFDHALTAGEIKTIYDAGGNGKCQGACATAPVVDDGNPCTVDTCDPQSGAVHTPVPVGTVCSPAHAPVNGVTVAPGFRVEKFATVKNADALAFAPAGSAFGSDLYVASPNPELVGDDEAVFKVRPDGVATRLATFPAEADISTLEFAPAGSQFGGYLYVSANNLDDNRPGDFGGAILRVDPSGKVTDLTAHGLPDGPGEPGGFAFGRGVYGDQIYLANSTDVPASVIRVQRTGTLDAFVNTPDYGPWVIAMAPEGPWGGRLYTTEWTSNVIRSIGPDGALVNEITTLPATNGQSQLARASAFATGGAFATDLFVMVPQPDGPTILRVRRSGEWTVFARGFLGVPGASSLDGLAFSPDGTGLYVSDFGSNTVYRITADAACDATGTCARVNLPPTVSAGDDQSIAFPSSASLSGTVADDGLPVGSTTTLAWTKVFGPGDVTFANAAAASTTATFSTPGPYVLRLEASDGELTAFDDVAVSGCAPVPAGLVGWWTGDGTTGDLLGASPGTPKGGVTFVPGEVNQAFGFNGADSYVDLPDNVNTRGLKAFSVDAWVKTAASSPDAQYIYTESAGVAGPNLGTRLQFYVQGGTNQLVFDVKPHDDAYPGRDRLGVGSSAAIVPGQWTHVAGVWQTDGATTFVKVYVNGVETSTSVASTTDAIDDTPPANGANFIGAGGNGLFVNTPLVGVFNGAIDEVEFFNRAISPAEIMAMYTAGSVGKCRAANPPPRATVPDVVGLSLPAASTNITTAGLNVGNVTSSIDGKVELQLDVLPSLRGWKYDASGESHPEERIFHLENDVLRLDSIGVAFGSACNNVYDRRGEVKADMPFAVNLTARLLAEENPTASNHWGFGVQAGAPGAGCGIGLGEGVIQDASNRTISTAIDTSRFHDYRVECDPKAGTYRLLVDGAFIASNTLRDLGENRILIGDVTCGQNARAEVTRFEFEQDVVSRETPAAGTLVAPASSVDLDLSSGPATARMPMVFGLGENAASSQVTAAGLVMKAQRQHSPTVPAGFVVGTVPLAGSRLSPGTGVTVNISKGPPQCVPAPTGLRAWWRGERTARDEVSNNVGTVSPGVDYAPGEVADGFLFEGGFVEVPHSTALEFGDAMTIEGWVRPNAGFGVILSKSVLWILEYLAASGQMSFSMNPAGGGVGRGVESPAFAVPTGEWTHIAVVADGNTLQMFVNGVPGSPAPGLHAGTNLAPLMLGAFTGGGQSFGGNLDELSIYARALTADEIRGIYDADTSGKCVAGVNHPPVVNAGVDQSVALPAAAILTGTASDDGLPTGSTLGCTWTPVTGPGVVTFSSPTTPTTNVHLSAAGAYVLRLTCSDGQLSAADDVTVTAVSGAPPVNQPPHVVCGPDLRLRLPADHISLTCTVADDDLPATGFIAAAWSIEGPSPDGAEDLVQDFDGTTATLTARLPLAGDYVFTLSVTDSELFGSDDVAVTLLPANTAPVVSAGPDVATSLPFGGGVAAFTLAGTVTDDGAPEPPALVISWFQESGPTACGIANVAAASTAVTCGAAGGYRFRLEATDGALTSRDTVDVTIGAARVNQAPVVSAGPDVELQLPTRTLALAGSATDDGLPTPTSLTVGWTKLSGPGPVTFAAPAASTTATFTAAGTYTLRLSASDGALTVTDDVTVSVWNAPDPTNPPDVELTAPGDGDSVTGLFRVKGTANDTDLLEWTLERRSVDDATWRRFASGSTPVVAGDLGDFDPTVLLNGVYELRLTAVDLARNVSSATVSIVVERNQKVGNFTVSFKDLSVPVAGIPIEVIRTYDSRDKRRGDFGIGWTLDINSVRVQKNRVIGQTWETSVESGGPFGGFLEVFCIVPAKRHYVTATFADGKVFRWEAKVTAPGGGYNGRPECQLGEPFDTATVAFVPLAPTTATLSRVGGNDVAVSADWPGTADLMAADGSALFDPDQFVVTLHDGRELQVAQATGLEKVTDTNGNVLEVHATGLFHSSGKSVTFTRDGQGRITRVTDPSGNVLDYAYDAHGDLASFKDQVGNTTQYAYDGNHYLLGIQDARGISPLTNQYDASGRLQSNTDANGNTITYTHDVVARTEKVCDRLNNCTLHDYDDRGNVLQTKDALGHATTYTYDDRDNKLTECNALGQCSEDKYDDADNKVTEKDALGHVTKYAYDGRGNVTSVTDPLGRATANLYDGNGNLQQTTDAAGHLTKYAYDAHGLQKSMTDALGHVTSYEYDGSGNLVTETDAAGRVTTSTYDANGNRATQSTTRAAAGGGTETLKTQYFYDGAGRLVHTIQPDGTDSRTEYNVIGQQAATVDGLGRRTTRAYDSMGRLIGTTFPDGTSEGTEYDAEGRRVASTDRGGRRTAFDYDALGRLGKTTLPGGGFTSTTYDAAGRTATTTDEGTLAEPGHTTSYEYDAAGRRTKVTDPLGHATAFAYDDAGNQTSMTDALGRTTAFEYDNLNRRTRTVFADGTSEGTGYDELGRRTSKTDQSGVVTSYGYDAAGRLTQVTDAMGGVTKYEYDEQGSQTAQLDALGHVTRFAYDELGRRNRRTLPPVAPVTAGASESMTYDAAGNLATKTDFGGRTTSFTYDAANRLAKKTYPDASSVSFTYTATGRRATAVDGRGTTKYEYDARDRLVSMTYPDGRKLTYAYDGNGHKTSLGAVVGAQSFTTTYSYDDAGRMVGVVDPNGGEYGLSYDEVGSRVKLNQPNGTETTYAYDALNRLKKLKTVHTPTGNVIQSYEYTLGATGIRTRIDEPGGVARAYGYDGLYRLTNEAVTGTGAAGLDYTKTFTYDAVGNRQRQVTTGFGAADVGYAYDERDRLLAESGGVAATYGWDDNGNMASRSGDAVNAWDYDDRLVKVTKTDGTVVEYAYDVDGVRVRTKVTPAGGGVADVTDYLVDTSGGLSHVVVETDGAGAVKATYVRAGDQLIATIRGGRANQYHEDAIESVRVVTADGGGIVDGYDYTAFGESITSMGTDDQPYQFSGEERQRGVGSYYLRHRFLAPVQGVFWSKDPVFSAELSRRSLYSYAGTDPVNETDRSGLLLDSIVDSLLGAQKAQPQWPRFSAYGNGPEIALKIDVNRLLGNSLPTNYHVDFANEVFKQAGIRFEVSSERAFSRQDCVDALGDDLSLDFPAYDYHSNPEEISLTRGRNRGHINVYYVETMRFLGKFVGGNLARDVQGTVYISNYGGFPQSLAHELGHVLFGGLYAHWLDRENLMYVPLDRATGNKLDLYQIKIMRKAAEAFAKTGFSFKD